MTGLRRHALVRLSQAPETGNDTDRTLVERWQAADRPYVVSRRSQPSHVALGFCTVDERFPDLRPRRVAARTEPQRIVDVARPPSLGDIARCSAAQANVSSFQRLASAAERAGIDIRVYGSWMWQALTDERHVHERSDLDVLVDVADVDEAERVAAFLEQEEAGLAFKLDGELSLAGLGEIHWREYRQGKAEVLVKSIDALRLMPRAELRA